MAGSGGSLIKISEEKITLQRGAADALISELSYKPRAATVAAPGQLYAASLRASVASGGSKASLEETLRAVRESDNLLDPTEHSVLFGTRRAVQVALAVLDEYKKLVGLEAQDISRMTESQKSEFQEKSKTAAAVTLFVWASYVQYSLLKSGNEAQHADHVKLPECILDDPFTALRCGIYYLIQNLAYPTVKTDLAVATTAFYHAELVLEEIEKRKGSFKFLDAFDKISYGIEGTDFFVQGLDRHDAGTTSVEFNRVELASIVGNADAKHFTKRLAERMVMYNFAAEKNVFVELGGFMPVFMGFGKPGTGKSMLISSMATLLKDYCTNLKIPFKFHPLPDGIIDSYQGNSAKNMIAWMRPLQSKDSIIFAPMDDAENVVRERTDKNVSEGERAIVGVFLRYTEGAYAIMRGNASIGLYTNIPEQIDAAVRSRIQGRMVIDGAVTKEDWLDQGQLWWSGRYKSQTGFVDLKDPKGYVYQSSQGVLKSMTEAAQTHDVPTHSTMRDVFDHVQKNHDVNSWEFYGHLFPAVIERFPTFSSRDYRNIQAAVDQRVMDFDMPSEWFEKPEAFTALDYETQKAMVLELRSKNMKGLSFKDIFRQEVVGYLDTYASIANADFDRAVEARVKELRINAAAMRQVENVRSGK